MKNITLVKSIVISFWALLSAQSFANPVTCPTPETLKAYSYFASFPYGFNAYINQPRHIVFAARRSHIGDPDHSKWAVIIYPVHGDAQEYVEARTKGVLDNLQSVANTSYTMTVEGDSLQYCAYTLPNHPEVSIMAYDFSFDDDDDDDYLRSGQKKSNDQIMLAKFKQLNKKLKLASAF